MPTTPTTGSSPKRPRKPRSAKTPIKVEVAAPTHPCIYCDHAFKHATLLAKHMCETKKRHLDANEKYIKLAFWVFQKFYAFHYKHNVEKEYKDFVASKYWKSFTDFGRYLLNLNAIDPKAFVEFLFRNAVPLTKWSHAAVYATYVRELNKKESPFKALERSILLLQQWSLETGQPAQDFFREIAPSRAVLWLNSGRISPWLFYAASSTASLLNRMSKEQMALVQDAIDPAFWRAKIAQAPEEFQDMKTYLDEFGI